MPRRERPAETTRSEHWLRVAVNEHADQLNDLIERRFEWLTKDPIRWFSPIKSDDYAEYYDAEAFARLGIEKLDVALESFWPGGGPRWDGLARTASGRLLLVEAKAYIEEAVDYGSGAKDPGSVTKIRASLLAAQRAFQVNDRVAWDTTPFYQYVNRLAHLYYLAELNHQKAYLLFLYFADAPDVPNPSTVAQWEGAERLTKKCLGLGHEPFKDRVGTIIWSVPEMLAGR